MDQRRVIAFLLISFAVLMFFGVLFPQAPPQPVPPVGAPAAENAAGGQEEAGVAPAEAPAGAAPAAGDAPTLADLPDPDPANRAKMPQFITLGSLDPASGYRMLVTVTRKGASIQRAEMSSQRLTEQGDRSGYLGELELVREVGGIRVQVVGAGTPAALAGILVDDVIASADAGKGEVEIASPEDLDGVLLATRPKGQLTLKIRRGGGALQSIVATLTRKPFAVLRPESENYAMRKEVPPAGFADRSSLMVTLASLGGKKYGAAEIQRISALLDEHKEVTAEERDRLKLAKRLAAVLEEGNWYVDAQKADSVTFSRPLPELKLELIKRYTLVPSPPEKALDENFPAYHLQLDVEVHNTAEEPQQVAYQLDGPTGMPTEGWWYANKISQDWGAAGLRDVSVRFDKQRGQQITCTRITQGKVETMEGVPLLYAGVDGQYFSAVLIPQKAAAEEWFDRTDAIVVGPKPDKRTPPRYTNVTCRLARKQVEIAPGKSRIDSYQVFLGPKRPNLLAEYHPGDDANYTLNDLIYYGWFSGVSRAMLGVLHFFYRIIGNYGIAIVLLTVLVRGAMFPLSFRQTQNMARMQALKPEMDRITEKYKNDMPKRSQMTQELYRKNKINPLGGCLPMLLQLPIFVGLYRSLMIDVELRGSPLLGSAVRWCSNLAAPDMLYDWSWFMPDFVTSGIGIFGLGPYLNVLPMVTVALFLVTQKMTMPPAANEQAEMQQKMMKYMTVFMCVLFYKVASGLCLYFIASSLWGIAERKLLKKVKNADEVAGSGGTSPPSNNSGGSAGRGGKPNRNGSPDTKKRSKPRRK